MSDRPAIYFDINATTPVDPRVLEAMTPYLRDHFGNAASSSHRYGWIAQEAIDHARKQAADLIAASHPSEIIFTSGATESDNLAIKGVAHHFGMTRADKVLLDALAKGQADGSIPRAAELVPPRLGRVDLEAIRTSGAEVVYEKRGDHIVTLESEHPAVLDSCRRLESEGFRVSYLPVGRTGRVDLVELEAAISDQTLLVAIMLANNEIGVVQPAAEIGALCHERGVLFFSDGVQAVGKVPVDVQAMNIDLLAFTAHKMYGPKGVGALYVRRKNPRVTLAPMIDGGGQERGLRSGTLNVPGIVGLGAACEIAKDDLAEELPRLEALRSRFIDRIRGKVDGVELNGDPEHTIPGNINLAFKHVDGESLMMSLEGVAVSLGSACHSESRDISHVLKAIGATPERAHSSVRFGLGRFTTEAEVDLVADRVIAGVQKLRAMAPIEDLEESSS